MTGVIVCGGKIEDYSYMKKYIRSADLIISADSGARHCIRFHVVPDMLIGDFDSAGGEDLSELASAGAEVVRFPSEKDMTDSELAVEEASRRGCTRIILLGALGTRLDHSISNIFLLKKLLDKDIEGMLADEHNEARLINSGIELAREEGAFITLLPVNGAAKGVTTEGLYYPLKNATLETGSSWGVSNQFSEDTARVTVKEGYLLVIKARD